MGRLRVMSAYGDTSIRWDLNKVSAGDLDALEAIKEAERIFREERARGATAFRVKPDEPAEVIDKFDRTAEQIVIVPRIAGG